MDGGHLVVAAERLTSKRLRRVLPPPPEALRHTYPDKERLTEKVSDDTAEI
jgi:hypothetical protein